MVDPKKMSIEDILKAARATDGGEGAEPAASEPAEAESPQPAASETPAKKAPADPSKMSVADMLAAARAADSGGGAAESDEAAEEEAPAAPAKPVDASKMSVADMLAAARSADKPGAKPAAKKAAAKPAAKPASKAKAVKAAPADSGPKDTASILAAARKSAGKPGPISKAEAAARAKADPSKAKKKVIAPPMPEKPAYAQRAEAAAPAATDRRGFVATVMGAFLGSAMAIGFSSLAVTHILWVLGLARFMFPNILTEPPTQFKVGFPTDYAFGQVQTKFKAQFGVWIVSYEYQGAQQIYALKSVCTHLGCTPNWLDGEQKFKCPCHGSGFYKDGINFEGPAPRPLERYAIRVADDGQLEVDKSRKFNEELGQWSDSASFVTV